MSSRNVAPQRKPVGENTVSQDLAAWLGRNRPYQYVSPRLSVCPRRILFDVKIFPMKGLYRMSVIATCISGISLFIFWNTALVLTSRNYCIVLFEVPFTNRSVQLPNWMWGRYPFLVTGISTLTAGVLWTSLFFRRRRMREFPR
jgi:hypothetical protein